MARSGRQRSAQALEHERHGRGRHEAHPAAPLFLYGTLLDGAARARRAGVPALARAGRPAVLRGWRVVTLRGAPYPTLVRDRRGVVNGLLVTADAEALVRLAAYEGPLYTLRPVTVQADGRARRARAWIAEAATRRDWPLPDGAPQPGSAMAPPA